MPKGPKGQRRPADVIGNIVKLVKAAAPALLARGPYKKMPRFRQPFPIPTSIQSEPVPVFG